MCNVNSFSQVDLAKVNLFHPLVMLNQEVDAGKISNTDIL